MADTWNITPQMLELLPKILLQLASDRQQPGAARVRAASALVAMNEQNQRINRSQEPVSGPAAATPAIRLEVTAEGIDALRAGFLGRLAQTSESGRPGATAIAD